MNDEFNAILIPSKLEDHPAALYIAILQACPQEWTPEDVMEMYAAIMSEYEEEVEKPNLTAFPGGKDAH